MYLDLTLYCLKYDEFCSVLRPARIKHLVPIIRFSIYFGMLKRYFFNVTSYVFEYKHNYEDTLCIVLKRKHYGDTSKKLISLKPHIFDISCKF